MTDKQIDAMIQELEESELDDDNVCVKYRPLKSEVPILINALKMYKASLSDNKMEQVAALFGKKLDEEFEIVLPKGRLKKCKFTADRGLLYYDRISHEWCKNYAHLDWLTRSKAVVVDD